MCSACDDDLDGTNEAGEPLSAALMDAARALEAEMPGTPVPDHLWRIFFGAASGAIDWPSMQRMAISLDRARKAADRPALGRRRARRRPSGPTVVAEPAELHGP